MIIILFCHSIGNESLYLFVSYFLLNMRNMMYQKNKTLKTTVGIYVTVMQITQALMLFSEAYPFSNFSYLGSLLRVPSHGISITKPVICWGRWISNCSLFVFWDVFLCIWWSKYFWFPPRNTKELSNFSSCTNGGETQICSCHTICLLHIIIVLGPW